MKATLIETENFMKSVEHRANISMTFTEFFDWTRTLNYKPFMKARDFDRLVSVKSIEAGLENTD